MNACGNGERRFEDMSTKDILRRSIAHLLSACLVMSSPGISIGQPAPNTAANPGGGPWPRQVACTGATLKVYQPQLNNWKGNLLDGYAAVSLKAQGSSATSYGVIWFTARTEVDKVNRLVTLDNFDLTKYQFPSTPNNGSEYAQAIKADLQWSRTVPLDLLESSLATTAAADQQKKYVVKNDPPRIIFSSTPHHSGPG